MKMSYFLHKPEMAEYPESWGYIDATNTVLVLGACVILWLGIWRANGKHLLPTLLVCLGIMVVVWASFFEDGPSGHAYLFMSGRGGAYIAGCTLCLWFTKSYRLDST